MTTYLGKSCSFCLPRVPFVNCRQFMYLVISLLVLRAGYGIWLYQFLIIAYLFNLHLSLSMTKQTKWHVCAAKTQDSLGIRTVCSESLCAVWVANDPNFRQSDSEDSGQTGRMPRLIWVFALRKNSPCWMAAFFFENIILIHVIFSLSTKAKGFIHSFLQLGQRCSYVGKLLEDLWC